MSYKRHDPDGIQFTKFINTVKYGLIVSLWSLFILPFLFLWLFKRHYEFGMKLKNGRKMKKIENFSLMLSNFQRAEDLQRDFEDDFQSLIQESGFTGDCKIIKSIYSTEQVKVQVFRDDAKRIERHLILARSRFEMDSSGDEREAGSSNLLKNIKNLEKKLEKKKKKITELNNSVQNSYLLSSCLCFVTLSSSITRDKILRSFKDKYEKRRLCRCCCRKLNPKYKIREAPSPSNINWQNFSIPKFQIICARFLTYIFLLLMLTVVGCSLRVIFEFFEFFTQPDSNGSKNDPYRHTEGSIGFYLSVEIFQLAVAYATQIICRFFDISFFKVELIISQGMWLGVLKVMTTLPLNEILILSPYSTQSKAFFVSSFRLILTQSLMKPTMKVFNLSNVVSILRIMLVRIKLCFGFNNIDQEKLNKIFTKPQCYLNKLYCEDLYITSIAFICYAHNPGATVACLVYFILKTFADLLLFLRFYADLEVDSVELSRHYLKLVRYLIAVTTFMSIFRILFIATDYIPDDDGFDFYIFIRNSMIACWVFLFFPYEFFFDYISRRVEQKDLIRRTEKSEDLLGVDREEDGLGEDSKEMLSSSKYYLGVSSLAEILRKKTTVSDSESVGERNSIL